VVALLVLAFLIQEQVVGLQGKLLLTGLVVGPTHQLRWNISSLLVAQAAVKKKTTLVAAAVALAVFEQT
jgi:hypothetical protein